MVITTQAPVAHVIYASEAELVGQLSAMQRRAELYVGRLRSDAAVEEYELERARDRAAAGLPPAPLTQRGRRIMAARYSVDANGYLVL